MRILLLSLICFILLGSCRKGSSSSGLIGKWKLVETSNASTGWKAVPVTEQQKFEFRADSTYAFTQPLVSSATGCTGKFKTNQQFLTINWTCQFPAYDLIIVYTLDGNELLLDYVATSSGYKARYIRE